jgi:integrase
MPRRSKGPRLYLDPQRGQWIIRDGSRFVRTGCGAGDSASAEKFLEKYLGAKHKPKPSSAPMIADVLSVYGTEVAPHKKTARNMSYNISNLLKWWGTKTAAEITTRNCRAYAATKTPSAAGADLKVLKSATMYWHKEYGPLTFIPQFWRPESNAPKERWLSKSEAAALLWAARRYRHLRRMILIGLHTGSRPGVILALQWDQIDFRSGMMSRTRDGEIQDKRKRAPRVKLGRKIMGHMKRWKKLDGTEKFICRFEDKWHPGSRQVQDPHGAWANVIKAAGLKGVTRHTLRHTRATWMMQAGVPIWEAAGFLGMTVKTLERVYGHHSPDHQERAANI